MWAIYIITATTAAGVVCWVKIGISKDPYKRLGEFQTASALKLALFCFAWVGSYATARALELAVHVTLAPFRMAGEWFGITPEDAQRTILQKAADLGISITWVTVAARAALAMAA